MKPGIIYKVENIINGKVYIGKTTQLLCKRKCHHKDCARTNKYNSYFHKAIRKHGWDNFEWSVIDTATNEKELNEKEIYWINFYKIKNISYNITIGGDGATGHKHSSESRLKMSEANKKKIAPKGENHPMYGKKHSEETRRKISETEKGKIISEEQKEFMRIRMTGSGNPMYGKKRPDLSERNRMRAKNYVSGKR